MFKSLFSKVRGWLYKLGIIKGVKKLVENRDLDISEVMYNEIEKWRCLYSGYFKEWHDITYQTIQGKQKRRMATLGMPKVVSEEMASIVFNEKCSINISEDTLSETIESILEDNGFYEAFQHYLEYSFAMGGMVVKPYFKDGKILISFVGAASFIPISWANGNIYEGVFVNESKRRNKKYTHLEWHLWESGKYVIRNELYRNDNQTDDLGIQVPLDELFEGLENETYFTVLDKPIFTYIKPNIANNVDMDSPLGVSIYANSLDVMKSLDIAFDSFQREFILGKKRILVPASLIRTVIDPETGTPTRYFDATDEVYQGLNLGQDSDEIKDISTELRVEEHIAAINALLNILAMQTGFSSGTFSFDGKSVKTATEVVSENSKTFRTKQSHEIIIGAGIKNVVETIIKLGEAFQLFKAPNDYEITVTFDDSIAEDKTGNANYWINLVSNGLSSKKKAIMKVLGLSEDEAIQMLQEIQEENKTTTPEMIDFFGMNKGEGDNGSSKVSTANTTNS